MKKALVWMLAIGCCMSSYATDARVASMGKSDAFFMDEESVFRNPANISMYPNMVYGSYGKINTKDTGSSIQLLDPFFGAIVSYSLNEQTEAGGQYPMLSLGAVFNRYDEMLDYVTMGKSKYLGSDSTQLVTPLGKIDLLIGYVLENGVMVGGGAYIAAQSKENENGKYETKLYKGNIGLNWPVAKTMDLEVSAGGGALTAISDDENLASQDNFGRLEVRLFSSLAGLNGDFVPKARIDIFQLAKNDVLNISVAAGLGLNLNIDKGFFWTGIEFLYTQEDSNKNESSQAVGGRVSFGIERNILWDWLVIRVGGQKSLEYKTNGPSEHELSENPSSDGTNEDLVGLGFGINIENRLRIDWVTSENIPYTMTNLFSGNKGFIFSSVSATYSF